MGAATASVFVIVPVCTEQSHEELKGDEAAWARLDLTPSGKRFVTYDYGDASETFEVRNCTCGSTLYKLVG